MTEDKKEGAEPAASLPTTASMRPEGRRLTQAPPPMPTLSGAGGVHPPDTDFDYWARQAGKPDWSHWANMALVTYRDACCLSLDIDPRGVSRISNSEKRLSKVHRRYQIAKSHVGRGLETYPTDDDDYYARYEGTGVVLSEFRAWAESLPSPFTFPDEFPKASSPGRTPSATTSWPWGSHETELLQKLAAAADRFWKLYDPTDPSTAPTNEEVAAWLRQQGVAGRNAQVMATILRANGLPTGPRK